jgi:hypothetical protein
MTAAEGRKEIERCSGSQFDPVAAAAFLKTPISHSSAEKDSVGYNISTCPEQRKEN